MLEQAQPLFHRQSIKNTIVQIAANGHLVVYAGAGVTIDRSSLGWNELVSGLLENYIKPEDQRRELLSKLTGLQGASAAAQMYRDDHKAEFRDRLPTDSVFSHTTVRSGRRGGWRGTLPNW